MRIRYIITKFFLLRRLFVNIQSWYINANMSLYFTEKKIYHYTLTIRHLIMGFAISETFIITRKRTL